MPRHHRDWLSAYVQYASCNEAPKLFHFWAGVSAIGGALRRKVWFDQVLFQLTPSFFIVFVGPPAVITKSTTMGTALGILRDVPGIKFGPDSTTWQKMCETLADSLEEFQHGDDMVPMSPLTFASGELGSLVDLRDSGMVNFLIEMWDGKKGYEKQTKTSGDDSISAPWVNILGCTTPTWIAENLTENAAGGGFTSRCIFIYGDRKERRVAFLKDIAGDKHPADRLTLLQDLEHIATRLVGEYELEPAAKAWCTSWYDRLWDDEYSPDNPEWLNGYIGRKQAHHLKLSMVMAAAQRDELVLTLDDVQLADVMLRQIEPSMQRVFARVGRSRDAVEVDKLMEVLARRGEMPFEEAFRILMTYFPGARNIADVLAGAVRAGHAELMVREGKQWLKAKPSE